MKKLLYLSLSIFAIAYLLPLAIMLLTSFRTLEDIRSHGLLAWPQPWSLDSWYQAWSTACIGVSCVGISKYFLNSIILVIPSVTISTMLGALNGYILTQWRFRGSNFIFTAMLFGCFIPFQVILLPMAQVLGWLGLANTLVGLMVVHVVYGLSFTTLFFRNYYITIPRDLIHAAQLDGAGFFSLFFRILVPISTPVFMVSIIWQFTQIWNDFLFGVVFSGSHTQPMTVALNNLVNTSTGVKEYNVHMSAALITALPTLLIYVIAGKYFVQGLTSGSVK